MAHGAGRSHSHKDETEASGQAALASESICDQLKQAFSTVKPSSNRTPVHKNAPKETVCFGLMTEDTQSIITAWCYACLEMFQVTMACLLAILVPQDCNGVTCSTHDLFFDTQPPAQPLSSYHFGIVVLVWNFITLGAAVVHYTVIYRREKYLIRFLDDADEVADDRLPEVLPLYPEIDNALYAINMRTFVLSVGLTIFFVINVVLSAILVFHYRYNGVQTATVYATNIGLITSTLTKSFGQSWAGMKHRVALSLFVYEPKPFNVIDTNYVDARDQTNGGRIDIDDKDGKPIVPQFAHLPVVPVADPAVQQQRR